MNDSVTNEQRFSKNRPCPICGGYPELPKGQGIRCHGFYSNDGNYALCSRDQHAGDLTESATTGLYRHRLGGKCKCGSSHAPATPSASQQGKVKELAPIVATYDYHSVDGELRFQVVRRADKRFGLRRPNGSGGWLWNLKGTERLLYQTASLIGHKHVYVVEGEKDVDRLRAEGMVATTSPLGAGKFTAAYALELIERGVEAVTIVPDNDEKGLFHARDVAKKCLAVELGVKVITLPGFPSPLNGAGEDVSDWFDKGHTAKELVEISEAAPSLVEGDLSKLIPSEWLKSLWEKAVPAPDFISQADDGTSWLEYPVAAPGAVTEIFSPRGIGKTHIAHELAVRLAKKGFRVLLVDRDNPKHEVRRRLKQFGAGVPEAANLRVLSREDAPPLTDTGAWRTFPVDGYDLVIIDSLDSSAEGVGEGDSSKPSKAIASILDIAHRESGPAVIVLGNTVKSGKHSRGSGIVEDRADICFEVRDATGLQPKDKEDWLSDLPEGGAAFWKERAKRRKQLQRYQLALVPTKFRIGEEPAPFILEINMQTEPWTVLDVTDLVLASAEQQQKDAADQAAAKLADAISTLRFEIGVRAESGQPPLKITDAEFRLRTLTQCTREVARSEIKKGDGSLWQIREVKGQGNPKVLELIVGAVQDSNPNGNGDNWSAPPTSEGL